LAAATLLKLQALIFKITEEEIVLRKETKGFLIKES
jgi:hypothetical protein